MTNIIEGSMNGHGEKGRPRETFSEEITRQAGRNIDTQALKYWL